MLFMSTLIIGRFGRDGLSLMRFRMISFIQSINRRPVCFNSLFPNKMLECGEELFVIPHV